jgi:hypothetical protein
MSKYLIGTKDNKQSLDFNILAIDFQAKNGYDDNLLRAMQVAGLNECS